MGKSCRVLIVEDVEPMLELMNQALSGFSDLQISGLAKNGPEARFEAIRRRPDIAILDEILPGESSHDLLMFFKDLGVPVLVMSGADQGRPIPDGACGRIPKPAWKTLKQDGAAIRQMILDAWHRFQVDDRG